MQHVSLPRRSLRFLAALRRCQVFCIYANRPHTQSPADKNNTHTHTQIHTVIRFGIGANAPCNVANSNLFGVASKRALASVAEELQSQQHVACHKQKKAQKCKKYKTVVIKTEQQPQRQHHPAFSMQHAASTIPGSGKLN